jgi:hypothetical protein
VLLRRRWRRWQKDRWAALAAEEADRADARTRWGRLKSLFRTPVTPHRPETPRHRAIDATFKRYIRRKFKSEVPGPAEAEVRLANPAASRGVARRVASPRAHPVAHAPVRLRAPRGYNPRVGYVPASILSAECPLMRNSPSCSRSRPCAAAPAPRPPATRTRTSGCCSSPTAAGSSTGRSPPPRGAQGGRAEERVRRHLLAVHRRPDAKDKSGKTALEAYSERFRGPTKLTVEKEHIGRINKDTLKNFDAVLFFTTGNPLTKDELADLREWVKGGGRADRHALRDRHPVQRQRVRRPDRAYFKTHPAGLQKIKVKVEDPKHPAAAGFTDGMDYQDEMYIFKDAPYSRERLHIILSVGEWTNTKLNDKQGPPGRRLRDLVVPRGGEGEGVLHVVRARPEGVEGREVPAAPVRRAEVGDRAGARRRHPRRAKK